MKAQGLDNYDLAAACEVVDTRIKQVRKAGLLGTNSHLLAAFLLRVHPHRLAFGNALPIAPAFLKDVSQWTLDEYFELEKRAADDRDEKQQAEAMKLLDSFHNLLIGAVKKRGAVARAEAAKKRKRKPKPPT